MLVFAVIDKFKDIDRLEYAIKNLETQLIVYGANLSGIDKELARLNIVEAELETNLAFLKKKKIIALALEYKKIKDHLSHIKKRKSIVLTDKQNIEKAHEATLETIQRLKERLESLKENSNNIIEVDFTKKR